MGIQDLFYPKPAYGAQAAVFAHQSVFPSTVRWPGTAELLIMISGNMARKNLARPRSKLITNIIKCGLNAVRRILINR